MHRFLILAFTVFGLVAGGTAVRAADQKPPQVSWVFETHADKDATPHSRVFLQIDKRRVLVARDLTAQFSVVPTAEYKQHGVPGSAAAACSGWWAGQGEDFYAVHRHGHWEVFRRDLDEQAPIPAYRRVRSIPAH